MKEGAVTVTVAEFDHKESTVKLGYPGTPLPTVLEADTLYE
jgi:hypothetical protein